MKNQTFFVCKRLSANFQCNFERDENFGAKSKDKLKTAELFVDIECGLGYNLIMKNISCLTITECIRDLVRECGRLSPSCKEAMTRALENETNQNARFALQTLVENARIAEEKGLPVCQDTGMAVFFIRLGQDAHIEGGLLEDAVNEGVRIGYAENGYRASVLDPITRINTKDNTPSIIHLQLVKGEDMEIYFMPKGFGSENMSKLYMLTPSKGLNGVVDAVVDAVKQAGANPCPPVVVGVGIGGTAEKAMELAKVQLLREVGQPSPDQTLADLEKAALERINALNIGAQGFKGRTTAYAVHMGKFPTHIAALPVAVNIQCNAVRLGKAVL